MFREPSLGRHVHRALLHSPLRDLPPYHTSNCLRSCTWLLRVNISGSSVDHNRNKKVYPRELSWHPSGPLSPGATLDAGHSNARRLLRLPPVPLPTTLRAHTPTGCGHGGTRKSSISRKLQTWSVNPAAMAGVWGCQRFADPVPCVGSGSSKGIRKLACGRQKLS